MPGNASGRTKSPYSVQSQNGMMVKVTEFHEHAEGKVSGYGVKPVMCWPQHKSDPNHALACEAFVQYKVPNVPQHPGGTYPWVITVVEIDVKYFTPFPCGSAHWTAYERWPLKGGKSDLDPRQAFAPYGPLCPPTGVPLPCAMQVTHRTTATLKALPYPPNQENLGALHYYGADGSAKDANGNNMVKPDGSLIVDDTVPPGERAKYGSDAASPSMSNGSGPIHVVFSLEWFPVDCTLWPSPTIVPADPKQGQQFARVGGGGGSGLSDLSSVTQAVGMASVLSMPGLRPVIEATAPLVGGSGLVVGGQRRLAFGFGRLVSGVQGQVQSNGVGSRGVFRQAEGALVKEPAARESWTSDIKAPRGWMPDWTNVAGRSAPWRTGSMD